MGRNHLNLETTLGLVYISATFVVLCALALPLPERFKRTLAPVITQTARVLAYAIVIPAYLTVNGPYVLIVIRSWTFLLDNVLTFNALRISLAHWTDSRPLNPPS
jgi:hypothetical protein